MTTTLTRPPRTAGPGEHHSHRTTGINRRALRRQRNTTTLGTLLRLAGIGILGLAVCAIYVAALGYIGKSYVDGVSPIRPLLGIAAVGATLAAILIRRRARTR